MIRKRLLLGLTLGVMTLSFPITAQEFWEQVTSPPFESFNAVKDKIRSSFYAKVDDKKLEIAAIHGMLKSLGDPYSRYLDVEQYEQFKLRQNGGLDGFGLQMGMRDGKLTVIAPITGSPAQKAGVNPLDTVLMINGKSTQGLALDEAMAIVQEANVLRLRIASSHDKKTRDLTLRRSVMALKAVSEVREFGSVGYIRLISFEPLSTASELTDALLKLQKPYIRSILLDLRNNGGGLLNQAAAVLGLFIQEADAIYTISKDGRKQAMHVSGSALYRGPLVVLINHGSASSSEIVAGALKDLKRASVVGENSFGKASVQKVIELPDGSALLLTVAHYLTPNGVDISKVGIAPNYFIRDSKSAGKDSMIEEAVSIATEQGYRQKQ